MPETSEAVAGAQKTRIERNEPAQPGAPPVAFDTVLQHFRSTTQELRVRAGELADRLVATAERGVTIGVR